MRHQEFLEDVATRGGFAHTDDARTGADAVLATLAEHLPGPDRLALADALPGLLAQESGVIDGDGTGAAAPDEATLVEEVAHRAGWNAERARYALTAVLGAIAEHDRALGERIARVVPSELVAVSTSPGPPVPPDVASESAQGRPQPVGADELSRALERLVDWSGDVEGIVRTVELPAERVDLVLERIHRAETELAARVRILDRQPTSVTLRARTESMGVVTGRDLELAERVDEAVAVVGSGG